MTFFKIEKCIQDAYLEYRDKQKAYLQIQFTEVTVKQIEAAEIYLHNARNVRLGHGREHSSYIKERHQVYYSNLKQLPQHPNINEKKRQLRKLAYGHIKNSPKYKFIVEIRK